MEKSQNVSNENFSFAAIKITVKVKAVQPLLGVSRTKTRQYTEILKVLRNENFQ